jgi:hypothetical protein
MPITSSVTNESLGILTNGIVEAGMYETVRIIEDGSCQVIIAMTAYSPSLVMVYERALGFDESMSFDVEYDVPESIPVEGQVVFNPDITVLDPGATDVVGTYPVNSSFCDGVYQQQLLSLGIRITNFVYVRMLKESATGYFQVLLEADAEFLEIEGSGKDRIVTIGPATWEVSCDHASFLLTKIAYIQEMLGNLTGPNSYHSLWTTHIVLPDTTTNSNWEELIGTSWGPVYFGNQSAQIYAQISSADVKNVFLEEDLTVSENQVSKTEDELWQDLLCYKIFKIEYDPPVGGTSLTRESASIIDDFSWGIHFTIFKIENQKFTVQFGDSSGHVTVTMSGSFSVSLSANVGFSTEWFKLKKFYGYAELQGKLDANFTMDVDVPYEHDWSEDIFEWSGNKSKPPTFWIGAVPVWLIPHFTATAKFHFKMENYENRSITVGCGAEVNGWMKAGVGWKKRFYPILGAGMDVLNRTATWDVDIDRIDAEPSLGFKPAIMFYDAAGPAVEIEPYLRVIYWDPGSGYQLEYAAGVRMNIGISFSGWFKKITKLDDWFPVTLFDWELWMYPPRPAHDIGVANIRSEEQAFVGETVTVSVDVVNLGSSNENNNVDVALYYKNGSDWMPIGTKTGESVPNRYCKTLNFTWDTTEFDGRDYTLNATATVAEDADSSNGNKTHPFKLNVQDIAVIDLEAIWTWQEIVATVENAGTGNLSSVVVLLYYDGSLVGDDWCDYMRMAFNLLVGEQTELCFSWNMTACPDLSEYVAEAIQLPYETITENNTLEGARFVVPGDVNDDGICDMADISILIDSFLAEPGSPDWRARADLNKDKIIDMADITIAIDHFLEE